MQTHKSVYISKKIRKNIGIGRCLLRRMGCLSRDLFRFKENMSLKCSRNKETASKINGFRRGFGGVSGIEPMSLVGLLTDYF